MAKVEESVEIKFNAETAEYDEAVEKSSKKNVGFTASVGSFIKTSVLAGAALLKFNAVLKFFNFEIAKNLKSFAIFNITTNSLAKSIWTNLIPAFVKLRIVMASTGIGLIVLALASLVALLTNTVKGSREMAVVWKGLGNIMRGLLEILTGIGKVLVGIFTLDAKLILEGFSQSWKGLSDNIGNAFSNARNLVLALEQLEKRMETLATRMIRLNQGVQQFNLALKVLGQESELSLKVLDARLRLEEELLTQRLNSINLEAATILTKDKQTSDDKKKLDELNAERLGIIAQKNILRTQNTADKQEIIENISARRRQNRTIRIERQTADTVQGISLDAAAETVERNLIGYQGFANDRLEIDKDFFTKRTEADIAAQKRAAGIQANIDKDIADVKLKSSILLATQVADLGVELAGDDRRVQGALLISKAIASTALGIIEVAPKGPFAIAAMALLGATQIANIAAAMKVQAEGNTIAIQPRLNAPLDRFETARTQATAIPQPQQVLVVEDFNQVSNRIQVVDSRSTIGG